MTVVLKFKDAELRGAVPSRHEHRRHPRREERGDRGDQSGRHRPLQARLLDEGRLDHPRQVGRLPRRRRKIPLAQATFRFISDPSAAVAAMLAGDVDAFPRFANVQALDQFKADPRFQVLIGGTEGKTILAMNNKKKPLDDLQGAAGDRLRDRPQGDHRRRDERPTARRSAAI